MNRYLKETELLDYNSSTILELIEERGWRHQTNKMKIKNIYVYVRDSIKFGYNEDDNIPSSQVLRDGYGQCNTKGILFMALLRAVGIPCRLHGFTINKELQKGAITGIWYAIAPKEIIHSWVEVYFNDQWFNIEGFILDIPYLSSLQRKFKNCSGGFCGFGVATDNFTNPQIFWDENDTYIQKEGINRDFGIFDDPDTFFTEHQQNMSFIKKFMYRHLIRHSMNKNVIAIRGL
ncbi:transglutaminase-like domain-containing protein [Vallitalea okinawensis]|uniref:transglutaminase-like domain-containing protein n=1 Tax=Vallitalea okinawensis TaxID=2078660 RepID=UPI000CFC0750|nr:transglutaminase family protein [Vallitalea okinawensis]